MKMSALVFGADGQIGRELISLASSRGLDFRGLARADADITDGTAVKRVFERFRPSLVVNCAAYTAVDRAESEPAIANAVNADGAGNIANNCASVHIPLVHISTDYVFDGSKQGRYIETDVPAPLNVYGASKLKGEIRIRETLRNHIILRTSWIYSLHGNNFLKTMLRLAMEQDELRIVRDQFGSPTSAADAAAAILAAVGRWPAQDTGVYHFAGSGRASWYEFACSIVERQRAYTGRSPKVIAISTDEYPAKARRPMNSALDSELFSKTFGYTAKPWQDRMNETVGAFFSSAGPSKEPS
jgi:dTDP-4-dehydrorhamnose reductase